MRSVEAQTDKRRAGRIVHRELSYSVVGCAQQVHAGLGPGFPEAVYQKAVCHELIKAKIPFQSQAEMDVAYDGIICGAFKADLVVDDRIILELKAVDCLSAQHDAQALTYLKASGLKLAILINFGEERLVFRRLVN